MSVGKVDLVIEKGATFRRMLSYQDSNGNAIPLAGYTARMQIRETVNSPGFIIELTTENGGISISSDQIYLYISDTDTSAIAEKNGLYDLELIAWNGDVIKLIRGTVRFIEEITK